MSAPGTGGEDAQSRLDALTLKFESWQAKAKSAMDRQRAQNRDLEAEVERLQADLARHGDRPTTAAPAATTATPGEPSRAALLRLQLEEAERRLRGTEAALSARSEGIAAHCAAAVRIAAAATAPPPPASHHAVVAAETDKQRTRSERALLQANAMNVELTERVTELQDALRNVTAERERARERLDIKDNTIRALESQLVEATVAVQHAVSRAERAEDDLKMRARGNGAARDAQPASGSRPAQSQAANAADGVASPPRGGGGRGAAADDGGANAAANTELRLALDDANGVVRELQQQVDQLTVTLHRERAMRAQAARRGGGTDGDGQAAAGGAAGDGAGALLMSEAERDELVAEADALRAANGDLRARVGALEMRCAADSTATSTVAALRQQLATKSRQLAEMQETLTAARSQPGAASGAGGGGASAGASAGGVGDPHHMAHLRSTVVQLLVSDRDEVRGRLVPVVAALLQLPSCDVRAIYQAHPEFAL
jgi:hypothetical protein